MQIHHQHGAEDTGLSTSLDDAGKQAILDRIDALQAVLDEGKSPTEGMIKKLKDLL